MTDTARIEQDTYNPIAVEEKWQSRWHRDGTNNADVRNGPRPYYCLMMFPYPSAEGLHVGNLFAFTGNDIHGRFQRMQGHTVFEPMGYDAFGIHSENYALKVGVNPMELIPRNIENFRRQLKRAGLMIDWRYELSTTDPRYYKWTQWLFLQLYKRGLAYKKRAAVNWCPNDKTVLANEQVVAGACERCGTMVEQRFLEQWFFEITKYAGRLLDNLDRIDWSETTKTAQRNWIGRSEGAEIAFDVLPPPDAAPGRETPRITVFTTRADTIFGASYLVLAPEHPLVAQVTPASRRSAVDAYRERTAKQDLIARKVNKEKTGVFTGAHARNPATGQPIPIWIADYVLMGYGTGAIMAVPGHDQRDFEFAQAFGLPIVRVVAPAPEAADMPLDAAEAEPGVSVHSHKDEISLDGRPTAEAKAAITAWLEGNGLGRKTVHYKLRDWLFSRQRYWGEPFPILLDEEDRAHPVPEAELPVLLPELDDFRPTGRP